MIIYASLGSFIVDDIHYADGHKVHGIIGGAGVYAIYGMRVWLPPPDSQQIGYVLHCDPTYATLLDTLNISLIKHTHPYTPRGLNVFDTEGHRTFTYLQPIIHTQPSDLPHEWTQSIQILHLICSPDRLRQILPQMNPATSVLWEPVPWSTEDVFDVAHLVTIFSPNHEEAAKYLNTQSTDIEWMAKEIYRRIQTVVVIRAGSQGSCVCVKNKVTWVPAYPTHPVDVTGAGNAYCGGYAVGWVKTKGDPVLSAYYGSVSASYAIEQVGPPLHLEGAYDRLKFFISQTDLERSHWIENNSNKCI
ncbi:Ribokinase-like protein [Pilobolus umbonatus]|nr:Ribokinase-like protein [Pilobolus umbonatus]